MAKIKQGQDLDFDKNPTESVESEQAKMLKFMKTYNANEVKLAGTVRSTYVSDPKQKFDKKTNEPILDENGMPTYWEPYRSVTIAFEGGELQVNVQKDMFETMIVGQRYLFEGVKGLNFGKVEDVFHTAVKF